MNKVIILGLSFALLGSLTGCNSDSEKTNSSSSTSLKTSQSINQQDSDFKTNVEDVVSSSSISPKTSQSISQQTSNFKVSVEDAIKEYQKEYPNSDITSINLEPSFGNYFYKIEGVDNNKEYTIRVNANTKKISKEREEYLDIEDKEGRKRTKDKLNINNLLSIEKVSAIAIENVGNGKVTDWSLSKDMGTTYWKVNVIDRHKELEVKINAQSGNVLETEMDD